LETTPPEILSDVMVRGAVLVGGGAMITGLQDLLHEKLKIPIQCANDPLTAVVRGTGVILENLAAYREMFLNRADDLPPKE